MKVCLVGDGLTSFTLGKILINEGILVDLIVNKKFINYNKIRTIGISKTNIEFFNKNIVNIEKLLWNINKIEIFTENLNDEKVVEFNDTKCLFSVIKNYELYNLLKSELYKSKLFKIRRLSNYSFLKNEYDLVINCENNNDISRKYFSKKFQKNYKSTAYISSFDHEKIENNVATQIFTKKGPLAFLPLSDTKTSIVYSLKNSQKKEKIDLKEMIRNNNKKYNIKKINEIFNFKLISLDLRNYHYKNILAFGDSLHRIHPLAGQGFNMSVRDIKILINLIRSKVDLGLELNSSICKDFENKARYKNFIFSTGIDLIYEFFNFESNSKSKILSKSLQIIGKNKSVNQFFNKVADVGFDTLYY